MSGSVGADRGLLAEDAVVCGPCSGKHCLPTVNQLSSVGVCPQKSTVMRERVPCGPLQYYVIYLQCYVLKQASGHGRVQAPLLMSSWAYSRCCTWRSTWRRSRWTTPRRHDGRDCTCGRMFTLHWRQGVPSAAGMTAAHGLPAWQRRVPGWCASADGSRGCYVHQLRPSHVARPVCVRSRLGHLG